MRIELAGLVHNAGLGGLYTPAEMDHFAGAGQASRLGKNAAHIIDLELDRAEIRVLAEAREDGAAHGAVEKGRGIAAMRALLGIVELGRRQRLEGRLAITKAHEAHI